MTERLLGLDSLEKRQEVFVGKPAPEAFTELVHFLPKINSVTLISYIRGLEWGKGYPTLEEQLYWGVAKENVYSRQQVMGKDFWNKRFEELERVEIPANLKIAEDELAEIKGDDTDVYLSISSRVQVKLATDWWQQQQVPLVDFSFIPSDSNLHTIKDLLKEHGDFPGVILDSGASYHYWGLRTLELAEWDSWLNDLKAFAVRKWWRGGSVFDLDFIDISLRDGLNYLRVTSGVEKPVTPRVVDVI